MFSNMKILPLIFLHLHFNFLTQFCSVSLLPLNERKENEGRNDV